MMLLYIIVVLQLLSLTGASESGIVAGKESNPHSRRYMASLQVGGDHYCGGMLIREDFVLTAAHCKINHHDMTVVLGAHNIKKYEKSQQKIPVAEYIPHPKYDYNDAKNMKHDIMLLKLKRNAMLNEEVQTIGLPKWNEKVRDNTKCLVAGWGRTHPGDNSPPSDVLRETTVQTNSSAECKRMWQDNFNKDQMICTHTNGKRAGICQGDSGGPLICGCCDTLHGITSFTLQPAQGGCDDPKYPQVFTKVAFFSKWIKTEMD